MKAYQEWIQTLNDMSLPRYDDLPQILLYSDQVIEFVNASLEPLFGTNQVILTSAMINNYVKNKMMPAPYRKRYSRDHLAYILTITVLKQVISIPEIVNGIRVVRDEFGKEEAYNTFITYIESGVRQVIAQTHDTVPFTLRDDPIESTLVPIKAASVAFAAKLIAVYSLRYLLSKEKD